ncbi:MAG TPA: hypothetical protein VGW33_04855 [Terriglobia bacterium]|nr:hypothetical protein [Terriglobia bacterium]
MTLDEADKKIEFILQMQAQFEANLGRLETNLGRLEANTARNTAGIDTLRQSVAEVAIILRESIRLGDERISATNEQLRRTDERLNALISVVERHVSGPGHGHSTQ